MPVEETEDFDLIFGNDDGTGSLILKSSPIASHKRSASVLVKDGGPEDDVREEIIGSASRLDGKEDDEVDYEIGEESPKRVDIGSASTPV